MSIPRTDLDSTSLLAQASEGPRGTDLGEGRMRLTPRIGSGSSPTAAALDLGEISATLIMRAQKLGFVRAGIASLEPYDEQEARLEGFLADGHGADLAYLSVRDASGRLLRADPTAVFAGARSVIVVALAYQAPAITSLRRSRSGDAIELNFPANGNESGLLGSVANYAQGADYHLVIRSKLLELAEELAELMGSEITVRPCVDTAPVLERDLALRAGFAFLGKNTLAIAPGAGSHFLLGELFVDQPLVPSVSRVPEGCGSCTACLDACPTSAFVDAYRLDARKCISYLTIESSADIPRELRAPIGNRIFGCDVCQSVCPYNRSGEKRTPDPALIPRPELSVVSLIEQIELTSSRYKRFVKGTALNRVSRNQLARNAAVALGNSACAEAVSPLLAAAQTHVSEQVRAHATWALGELGHRHGLALAREALDVLRQSGSPAVLEEARLWPP